MAGEIRWEQKPGGSIIVANGSQTNDASLNQIPTTFNNATNLNTSGWIEFLCDFTVQPSNNSPVIDFYYVAKPDGTNFVDIVWASGAPQQHHMLLASVNVRKVTGPQRIMTPEFRLPPYEFKFTLDNRSGQTLPAGWSFILYHGNLQVK